MAKYRARVDCHLEPSTGDTVGVHSRANGELFVNLVQHISSSMADLGIEMLAWNYGIGGSDWTFWDEPGATGRNAFACFRFHSASFGKFDCLIYENTGSGGTGNHTGSIYINNQNNQVSQEACYYQVGIAFACHPSGTVPDTYPYSDGPWNGTYGQGADINNATSVWKLSGSTKGAFFPRPNGIFGQLSGTRSSLQGIGGYAMHQSKSHFILSEDSVTIFVDDNVDGYARVMHFGPYTPRSGSNPESPYVMWSNGNEGGISPWVNGYGSTIGSTSLASDDPQGCIAHPDLSKGALRFSWGFMAHDIANGYNNFINSGSFEKFPVWAIVNEGTERGILGVLKHLNLGIGMNSLTVSTLSSSAAFGRPILSDSKVLVPWDGAPPQSTSPSRTGRNFSIG